MAESTESRRTIDDDFWDTKPTDSQTSDNNLGGVSVWCEENSLWTFTENVCDGDRLELVSSNLHSWAIYNALHWSVMCVVQFIKRANKEWRAYSNSNTYWNVSFPASEDVIVVTSIFRFLNKKGSKVRINNLKDKDWPPLGTGHICKAFTDQIKELHDIDAGLEVHLCRNRFKDSKHFVNYCRYDRDNQHKSCGIVIIREWYSEANIEEFIREVRVGDRLEFRCNSTYERWGIYIGQWGDDLEQVVLFAEGYKTNSAMSTERLEPKLELKSIRIHVVDGCDQVRINNEGDQMWLPSDEENILKKIRSQLPGRAHTHSECKVSVNDSEDFVNYCRYDNWRINFGLISEWSDHPSSLPLQVGDRLEFHRTALPYTHWGIYVGEWGADRHQVVHFAPADGNGKISKKMASRSGSSAKDIRVLHVHNIWTFLGKVRINNTDDLNWPPLDRENILKEIGSQLPGRARIHYKCKFSFKDSKDFVNHCRYDDINFGLVSDWEYYPSAMHAGDRLEFQRTLPYAHWGIYLGNWGADYNQVVHFAPADGNGKIFLKKKSSGSGSSAKDKPVLCVESFQTFSGKVRINNERDHIWPPFVRTDILDEIERQLRSQAEGKKQVYRLFSNNCEHFVNHCRYGKHHSDQVSPFSRIRDRWKNKRSERSGLF